MYSDPVTALENAFSESLESCQEVWLRCPDVPHRASGMISVTTVGGLPVFKWCGSGLEFHVSTADALRYLEGKR